MATSENYIGIAMGIDVSDLKTGLSEANKQIQLANSEFKAASSGMEDWTKSTEGLSAKIKQLDTILNLQRSKLSGLQAEYDKVAASQGENSEAARKLQVQINNQTAVVNKTEREFKNYKETLDQAEKGNIDLTKTSLKAGKAVDKMGDDAKKSGKDLEVLKKASGVAIAGIAAIGAAVVGAVTGFLSLGESTREYREDISKLQAAFQSAGHTTEQATSTYKELYSVFGEEDRAVEAAQQIANITKNEEEMKTMTNIATGVWAKFGDSLPAEGLMEAISHTTKVGEVQGNLADALEWSGVNLDSFNNELSLLNTEEERASFITNTLNDLYSKSADTYREVNKEVINANIAQSNLTDSMAALGDKAEPIMATIKQGFADILNAVLKLLEDVDFEAIGASIQAAFQTFIDDILPKIMSGLKWIIDNKDLIIAGIVGIGAAFLAWKVVGIIQAVIGALKGMTLAQAALNLVMSLNPIGLIVAAIAGLVAAFVVLWNKCDGFRNFWIGLWEGLKNAVGVVVEWIKENWKTMLLFLTNPLAGVFKYCYDHFEGFRNFVNNIVESVKKFFTNLWNNLKQGASNAVQAVKNVFSGIASFFSNTFQNAWSGIKNAFSNVKSFFSDKVEDIKSAFTGIKDKFLDVGDDIVRGIWQGIKDGAGWLKDKITGFTDDVSGWFKKTFKIGSPSKLMADEVGLFVGEGVGEGVLNSLPYVKKDLGKFSNTVRENLGGIKSGLSLDGSNSALVGGKNGSSSRIVNAGLTVNYNGQLSRKELKKTEDNYYKTIKLRLQNEGLV